ncbi:MAG: hypothetical protein WBM24_24850, partial [Candidatus Sulfotelmatobacter sp.]
QKALSFRPEYFLPRGRECVVEEPAVFSAEIDPASKGETPQSLRHRGRAALQRRVISQKNDPNFSPLRSPFVNPKITSFTPLSTFVNPT